jgi:hypothetical protein
MHRSGVLTAVVVLAAVGAIATSAVAAGKRPRGTQRLSTGASFRDSFPGTQLNPARWSRWWGNAAVTHHGALLDSRPPAGPEQTHSSLVTTREDWADFTLDLDLGALRQLRRHAPNTWETAWVLFRFSDLHDYYYVILKPNGWELGKKQGSDAQIFLATGNSPELAIGRQAHLRISAAGPTIRVYVGGKELVEYTDDGPLTAGAVGLYEEDSLARFSDVRVEPLQEPGHTPPVR